MKNPYYLLWADAILSFKKHHPTKKDWKLTLFISITGINGLNLWVVVLWLKYFGIYTIPNYDLDLFPGELLDRLLIFSAQFALPFAVVNYFLIFYQKKYEQILKKYKGLNGKYALIYSIGITVLAYVSAIVYGILT